MLQAISHIPASAEAPRRAGKVLLVDDEPVTRTGLSALLRQGGLQVIEAATVEQALAAIVQSPDVVLLDLMLPDGPGLDVLRQIRSAGVPARVAVISGVTESLDDDPLPPGLRPDAVFPKPLDLDALREWLHIPAAARRAAR